MDNTMIFFCDIVGTFTGYEDNQKLRKEYISKFLIDLKQMQIKNKYDKIIFSFLSSDSDLENISKCLKEINKIKKELNIDIQMGKQFIINGYIENNSFEIKKGDHKSKALTILRYLEELNKNNKIKLICYADDSEINQFMFIELKKRINEKTDYALFIPGGTKFNKSYVYNNSFKGIKGLAGSVNKLLKNDNIKSYKMYTKK